MSRPDYSFLQQWLELGLKCGCIRIDDCLAFQAMALPKQRARAKASRRRSC